MNDAYTRALHRIMTDDSPPPPTTRTRAEIETNIQLITDELKKPLSNLDRLGLVEDRQVLRRQLAALAETSHEREDG